jgi:hypothetical protein
MHLLPILLLLLLLLHAILLPRRRVPGHLLQQPPQRLLVLDQRRARRRLARSRVPPVLGVEAVDGPGVWVCVCVCYDLGFVGGGNGAWWREEPGVAMAMAMDE